MKDPRRVLSPHVADAHESSPAFEASMQGDDIISATWGDLASRIVEEGLVEPNIDAVCDYLKISREELSDPEITISTLRDAYELEDRVKKGFEKEFVEAHGETANELGAYMDERVAGWAVEDGDAKAGQIQRQIEDRVPDRFSDEWDVYNNDSEQTDGTALLCLKRDALYSGVQVPMIDFVKAVFVEFEDRSFFTNDDLAGSLNHMIEELIREYVIGDPETVKVEDVVIGKDQIDEFMFEAVGRFKVKKDAYTRQKWNELKPFLYAPNPYDYPLLRSPA